MGKEKRYKMESSDVILNIIYGCIDELNQQLPENGRLVKSAETVLAGDGGVLDSLGLITLLVDIELVLAERHGISVAILDILMAEQENQARIHTVAALLDWVQHSQATAKQAG